jgi:hypothetical protein
MVSLRKLLSPIYENLMLTYIPSGLLTYVALNGMLYLTKLVTRGYIVPEEEEHKEYWTIKPGGHLPWFIRLAKGQSNIFRPESEAGSFRKSDSASVTEVNHTVEEKM